MTRRSQRGAGLLFFVVALGIVAFSFVLGYAGILSRKQANSLVSDRSAYLRQVVERVAMVWPQHAMEYDDATSAVPLSAQSVVQEAGIESRYGVQFAVSNVLIDAGSGLAYRTFVAYLPSEADGATGFDETKFMATGVAPTCTEAQCAFNEVLTFSSLDIERDMYRLTSERLNKAALKAQAYFKARMLSDPEKNISVNYFRKPQGECVVSPIDLGCLDSYTPLSSLAAPGQTMASQAAVNLGLGAPELMSAWGQPLEASNLEDASTTEAPFTMSFRARTPSGSYIKLKAIQII